MCSEIMQNGVHSSETNIHFGSYLRPQSFGTQENKSVDVGSQYFPE
jgi:hypothetical protein